MKSSCPSLSIITPSYNQAEFLERTIRSVLDQNYENLEYIIIDGNSNDGSVDIIKKYEQYLAYWTSEPDGGQVDAINKGLRHATSDWVAWQNSDDVYFPGAFASFAKAVAQANDEDLIIGNQILIDMKDMPLRDIHYVRPTYDALLAEGMVLANQAAFWRHALHKEIGWLNENYTCSFDYEWFLRILKGRKALHVNQTWGGFRLHDEAKTANSTSAFSSENTAIIGARKKHALIVKFYQLRRLILLLAQGDISYVRRGLSRRFSGKGGGLI